MHDPIFDLHDQGKRDIPRQEDHPLILAWLRLCADPLQRCERKNCHRMAYVAVDEYEDGAFLEQEMNKSNIIFMKDIEDKLWRHTVEEQLSGKYTVYQTFYHCREHILSLLMAFLNTEKREELAEMLDGLQTRRYTMVQWHRLSDPNMGIIALVKPQITTPEALLEGLKHDVPGWKLQK